MHIQVSSTTMAAQLLVYLISTIRCGPILFPLRNVQPIFAYSIDIEEGVQHKQIKDR